MAEQDKDLAAAGMMADGQAAEQVTEERSTGRQFSWESVSVFFLILTKGRISIV